MADYFVTRHQGAIDWAKASGINARMMSHFDPEIVQAGDKVLGTSPVNIAAEVCSRGAHYLHLILNLPPEARGHELTADDMTTHGATLQEYKIERT